MFFLCRNDRNPIRVRLVHVSPRLKFDAERGETLALSVTFSLSPPCREGSKAGRVTRNLREQKVESLN